MRRLVAALVFVALAAGLAGCGGSTQDRGGSALPPEGAKPPAKSEEPAYLADRSKNEDAGTPTAFPSFDSTGVPAVIQEKLEAGRAMLILFYDPGQQQTNDVRAEVDAVMRQYRGLIDLVTFNVGGDPTSEAARAAATYAVELGVSGTPYLLAVDKSGSITWRWKGYVDRGVITREVERATQ